MDIPTGILIPDRIENGDVEIFCIEIIDDKIVYYMCETTGEIECREGSYCDGEWFDYPDSDDE